MTRRSNGDGSVSKIKGRKQWRVRITIDGKQKDFTRHPLNGRLLRTRKEANEARRILCVTHPATQDKLGTFGEFAERWLKARKRTKSSRTIRNNRAELDNHLLPAFGNKPLNKIASRDIDNLLAYLRDEDYKEGSLRNYFSTLRAILNAAKIQPNPCNDVLEKPRSVARQNEQIHPDKIPEFLATVEHSTYKIAWLLGMFCALRTSEICGLDWPHVKWTTRDLDICQAYHQDHELGPPKGGRARVITLPDLMIDGLNEHRRKQLALGHHNASGPVVTNRQGTRTTQDSLRSHWSRIRPIPTLRIHDLRGSHATALLHHGIDPLTAATRLGHSDASITLKLYAQMTKTMDRKAADEMQKWA